jgi:hypothetical protein
MVVKAGVRWDSLKLVKQGGLEALTGFISNEPNQLKAAGRDITVWQPVDYGIPSSLGAVAVNPAFAGEHPRCRGRPARGAACLRLLLVQRRARHRMRRLRGAVVRRDVRQGAQRDHLEE